MLQDQITEADVNAALVAQFQRVERLTPGIPEYVDLIIARYTVEALAAAGWKFLPPSLELEGAALQDKIDNKVLRKTMEAHFLRTPRTVNVVPEYLYLFVAGYTVDALAAAGWKFAPPMTAEAATAFAYGQQWIGER